MYKVIYYSLKLISFLPFKLLYFIGDLIYLIVYYIVRYRVNVVRENIQHAFPEKTEQERRKIEKKFFRHFADMIIEMLKMMSMSDNEMLNRMKYINFEPTLKHYEEGRGVILLTSHFGNWEWLSSYSLLLPTDKPVYQVYKKLSSDISNKVSYKSRKRFGAVNVEMKELLKVVIRLQQNGKLGMLGMISDQSPRRNPHLHFVEFLHQPTAVITGSEQLAKKFNFPVYFVSVQMIKRGYYTATFEPITLTPTETNEFEISEKYMQLLENDILKQPEQWLWSHKRWKHKPAT